MENLFDKINKINSLYNKIFQVTLDMFSKLSEKEFDDFEKDYKYRQQLIDTLIKFSDKPLDMELISKDFKLVELTHNIKTLVAKLDYYNHKIDNILQDYKEVSKENLAQENKFTKFNKAYNLNLNSNKKHKLFNYEVSG